MKYKKYSLGLLAITFLLGSCEKQLDLTNPQTYGEENAFQTMEHVQQGVNGAFGRFGTNVNDVYKSALVTDEVKIGPDNAGSGALTYRWQFGSDGTTGSDVTGGYAGYYAVIDQVNRVLPHVYTVTGGTQARRDVLQAHLLGLRGIAHFSLLQSFAGNYDPSALGVAVVTSVNPLARPARVTMGEVMTQIEKDLNDAKALLPAVTPASFSDTVLNKVNIAAYQARIALYKRDYDAAITYASEVINSNVKPLVTGSGFTGIWIDANSNESLFRIRFLTGTNVGALWTTAANAISLSPSDKLVASYDANDIRGIVYIGNDGTDNFVNKHKGSSRGAAIVDLKACRTAEMYLIRAEAYAKKATPDLVAGAADLNALRAQRITGYVNETFGTPESLVTAVIQERFKELCFEGFRLFDLKRNNLPVQRDASDANPEWQTLPANSFRFVMPIPRSAISANPNIVQNPGY